MKGSKVSRHGSDGGNMPMRNHSNMHVSMGKPVSGPDKTRSEGKANSPAMKGGGKNTMPKAISHARGPKKG